MNYTTIYFKIENKNCEEKGYVEIYDDDEYIPEFYYWNYNTGYECKEIVCHKNEKITGLTDEQINEIEQFKELVNSSYVDWLQEYLFMCDEDEKDFLQIGELKITVGEEF